MKRGKIEQRQEEDERKMRQAVSEVIMKARVPRWSNRSEKRREWKRPTWARKEHWSSMRDDHRLT